MADEGCFHDLGIGWVGEDGVDEALQGELLAGGEGEGVNPLAGVGTDGICADDQVVRADDYLEQARRVSFGHEAVEGRVYFEDGVWDRFLDGLRFTDANVGNFRFGKDGPGKGA